MSKFLTFYEAMRLVHDCVEVQVSWYKLEETLAPIGAFNPNTVAVLPLDAALEPTAIWPPRPRAAPKYPPRRSPVGGEVAGESLVPIEDEEVSEDPEVFDSQEPVTEAEDPDEFEDLDAALAEVLEVYDEEASAEAVPLVPVVAPDAEALVQPENAPAPEEPAPPPAPKAEAGRQRRGVRGSATLTFHVAGGSISYYPSKTAFEAVCNHPEHGRCVVTRTSRAMAGSRRGPESGRPVGFLAAWLAAGQSRASKQEHWATECFDRPHAERAAFRVAIGGSAAGRTLLECERPAGPDEDLEPMNLQPYLPAM